MGRYRKVPENYFKFVNPIIISLIGVGMYLLLMAWLDPKSISPTYFGRVAEFATWLGTENNHLMKQIILVTLALHITESMIAVYLCHKWKIGNLATIAWTIQTLTCGLFSLCYLIWPDKQQKQDKKQEKSNKSNKKSKEKNNSNQSGKENKKTTKEQKNSNQSGKEKKSKEQKNSNNSSKENVKKSKEQKNSHPSGKENKKKSKAKKD